MKTNVRRSNLKKRRRNGFRRKMRTKAGRTIVNRQRRRANGKRKHNAKKR